MENVYKIHSTDDLTHGWFCGVAIVQTHSQVNTCYNVGLVISGSESYCCIHTIILTNPLYLKSLPDYMVSFFQHTKIKMLMNHSYKGLSWMYYFKSMAHPLSQPDILHCYPQLHLKFFAALCCTRVTCLIINMNTNIVGVP